MYDTLFHKLFQIRGRGFDPVLLIKDHNLIKWVGANSYRTTHYPYSEELMDVVDELGIVLIDECSAVSLTYVLKHDTWLYFLKTFECSIFDLVYNLINFLFSIFGEGLLETHKNELTQLIKRDKNRPSVVMWSVANEPRSEDPAAENYFR